MIQVVFIVILLFSVFIKPVYASFSFKIDSISKAQITNIEDEIESIVTITDLPSGDSYFRVAMQKNIGDTYFGFAKNNENGWVQISSSQDCKNYFKVTGPGSSSVNLYTKIGESSLPDNGQYYLKARRYTSTCSTTYDSEGVQFEILIPTPFPSPSPTQQPTNSPTQGPTQVPTTAPTVKPTPTKTGTPKPTIKPTPKITTEPTMKTQEDKPEVLSLSTTMSTFEPEITNNKKSPFLAIIFIIFGVGFLGYGGYMLYNRNHLNNNEHEI